MGDTLFKGKRVALLGPAPHIIERVQSFDEYDLVCRINTAVHMPNELVAATGPRCDVWYASDKMVKNHPDYAHYEYVQYLRAGRSRKQYLTPLAKSKFSEMHGFLSWARKLMKCEPNRGMKAIIDILLDKPQLLYITGFTFYQSEKVYYPGYSSPQGEKRNATKRGDVGRHLQQPQLKYFCEKVFPQKNVRVDTELLEVVNAFQSGSE